MKTIFRVELRKENSEESAACVSLDLPATPYELLDTMDQLRIKDGESLQHSWTYYHHFSEVDSLLDENYDLLELNALAQKLSELDGRQSTAFLGLLAIEGAKERTVPLARLIDLAYSTDCCHVVTEARDDHQLGRFLVDNAFVPEAAGLSEKQMDLLDFERIGREHRRRAAGVLVKSSSDHPSAYVERHSDLVEAYKDLDLTLRQPDYSFLLHVARGYHAPLVSECSQSIQLELPAAPETLEAALRDLGVKDWKDTVWSGLDCRVPILADMVYDIGVNDRFDGEWMGRLNHLSQKLADMEPPKLTLCKAILQINGCADIQTAERLMDTLDQYILSPQFSSPIEVAEGELSSILSDRDAADIMPYLDLYRYGEALIQRCGGVLANYGLIERKDGEPVQDTEQQPQWGGMEMM